MREVQAGPVQGMPAASRKNNTVSNVSMSKILWKYHVLSVRRLGYNCTEYLNQQLTENVTIERACAEYGRDAA